MKLMLELKLKKYNLKNQLYKYLIYIMLFSIFAIIYNYNFKKLESEKIVENYSLFDNSILKNYFDEITIIPNKTEYLKYVNDLKIKLVNLSYSIYSFENITKYNDNIYQKKNKSITLDLIINNDKEIQMNFYDKGLSFYSLEESANKLYSINNKNSIKPNQIKKFYEIQKQITSLILKISNKTKIPKINIQSSELKLYFNTISYLYFLFLFYFFF